MCLHLSKAQRWRDSTDSFPEPNPEFILNLLGAEGLDGFKDVEGGGGHHEASGCDAAPHEQVERQDDVL